MRLLLVFLTLTTGYWYANAVPGKSVTNEDIRDAILSVVYVIRSTEDKLERHEFRERALGEQLKKALSTVDKRLKLLDPVKGTISRLDDRLATVETILMQKDERERIQLQKTYETVEDIQKNLPSIVEKLKDDILAKISSVPSAAPQASPPPQDNSTREEIQKLSENLSGQIENLKNSLHHLNFSVGRVHSEVQQVKNSTEAVKKASENQQSLGLDKVQQHLNTTGELLEKYESKLAEYNNRIPTDVSIPTGNLDEDDAWKKNLLQALEVQRVHVEQILGDIKTITSKITTLPEKTDLEANHNSTLNLLQQVHQDYTAQSSRSTEELSNKLDDLSNASLQRQKELNDSIQNNVNITSKLSDNVTESYNQLKYEIQSLNKVEQLMVQTADSVLDTKRRVEYGIHQILLEVGGLIKNYGKDTNAVINERFDTFEMSILDEDTGALANLTSKIGHEIDQVWRQIGIMHQQMSASTDTLNKLQNQTDAYVNGSLNVMDNMKGKVGQITGRMSEVDENLNYLLGRLSLVTQEFNAIKKGLGSALDEIRESFNEVQSKVKDVGPGPHKIKDDEDNATVTN